jgi:uncharacterized protein YqjF (DUF2071 family)
MAIGNHQILWPNDRLSILLPVEEWVQRQLLERQPCIDRASIMLQRWASLLFLHWMIAPEMIQQTLPRGLSVDTYQGMACIGIVVFCMRHVRPTILPFAASDFLELNLRTYVRDYNENPGVWFYSLDANHPLTVMMARLFFALPYLHAKMRVEVREEQINYFSQRRGSSKILHYRFRPSDDLGEAKFGSLEFFLIERYRLFSSRRNQLFTGRVYHSPYQLRRAVVSNVDKDLFTLDGLQPPPGPPESILYSPGVDVTVYPIERVHDALKA